MVVVVGSVNVDYVVHADHLPAPGETVLGGRFERHFGGKGANQAVAAARAGAEVTFVGAVGRDADGDASFAALEAEGIDVSRVRRVDAPTGVALIVVGRDGENQIAVAEGANAELQIADLGMEQTGVLLASLEIPLEVALAAVVDACHRGRITVLNPAPAQLLTESVFRYRPILVPNEHELPVVFGVAGWDAAVAEVARLGLTAVVTRGERGATLLAGGRETHIPAVATVSAIDTTGAGDTYCGVLAAWLAEGRPLGEAARAAMVAAGLAVRVRGAREGMSTRDAILEALGAVDSAR